MKISTCPRTVFYFIDSPLHDNRVRTSDQLYLARTKTTISSIAEFRYQTAAIGRPFNMQRIPYSETRATSEKIALTKNTMPSRTRSHTPPDSPKPAVTVTRNICTSSKSWLIERYHRAHEYAHNHQPCYYRDWCERELQSLSSAIFYVRCGWSWLQSLVLYCVRRRSQLCARCRLLFRSNRRLMCARLGLG
jgi:hypothetical protein